MSRREHQETRRRSRLPLLAGRRTRRVRSHLVALLLLLVELRRRGERVALLQPELAVVAGRQQRRRQRRRRSGTRAVRRVRAVHRRCWRRAMHRRSGSGCRLAGRERRPRASPPALQVQETHDVLHASHARGTELIQMLAYRCSCWSTSTTLLVCIVFGSYAQFAVRASCTRTRTRTNTLDALECDAAATEKQSERRELIGPMRPSSRLVIGAHILTRGPQGIKRPERPA